MKQRSAFFILFYAVASNHSAAFSQCPLFPYLRNSSIHYVTKYVIRKIADELRLIFRFCFVQFLFFNSKKLKIFVFVLFVFISTSISSPSVKASFKKLIKLV